MLELSYLLYILTSVLLAVIIYLMPTISGDSAETAYYRQLRSGFTMLAAYAMLNAGRQLIELSTVAGVHSMDLAWASSGLLFFSSIALVFSARSLCTRLSKASVNGYPVFWGLVALMIAASLLTGAQAGNFRLGWENGIRLWIILPACFTIVVAIRALSKKDRVVSRMLAWLSFSIALYGITTSLVLKTAPGLPNWLLTYDEFYSWSGIPIQLVRALTMAMTTILILQLTRTFSYRLSSDLLLSNRYFERLVDSIVDGLVVIDGKGVIKMFNSSAETLFGWQRSEIIGKKVNTLMPEPHQSKHDAYLERYYTTGERKMIVKNGRNLQALRKDGSTFDVRLSVNEWEDPHGNQIFVGTIQDVTHHKEIERKFKLAWAMLENVGDVVVITNSEGALVSANPSFCALFDVTPDDALNCNLLKLARRKIDGQSLKVLISSLKMNGAWHGELWIRDAAGEAVPWLLATHQMEVDDQTYLIASMRCIQSVKLSDERSLYLASHDPLTGLLNRAAFAERLNHVMEIAEREKKVLALMYIDLDGFKPVNDTYGHDIGDKLLVLVGQRLKDGLRRSDTLARLGGDEFGVIMENVVNGAVPTMVGQDIIEKLSAEFLVDGITIHIGASIGIAQPSTECCTPEDLVNAADSAMYQAKRMGKGRIAISVSASPQQNLAV